MIEFSQVGMKYPNGTHALKSVSFKINDGEFVFVIGRSGSGKSTLIKLLTCEERPTAGQVMIDNYNISTIKDSLIPFLRRNIGMVFQDFRLIPTKTVFENVAFAMEIVGAPSRLIRRRVPIVLSIVGLRDKANARPGELSGGEQQRVAIARAMVNNPMIILADEPTGNLDPSNSEALMALFADINRSGTTVIICTHDWDLVNRMQRRVIEINEGLLIRDDCNGGYFCEVPQPRNADQSRDALAVGLPFAAADADPASRSKRPAAGARPSSVNAISTDASTIVDYDAANSGDRAPAPAMPEPRPGQERTDSSAAIRFADGVRGNNSR